MLKYTICGIILLMLYSSCNKNIYTNYKREWDYLESKSPKRVFIGYINVLPTFSDTFPEDKTFLDTDYSSYINYGKYKWVKIPVKIVDYKYNKAQWDYTHNHLFSIPKASDSLNYFDLSRFQYIILPYEKKSVKRKIIALYEKKQLSYIVDPKLTFESGKQNYKPWILTNLILNENIKYSSKLYPYPYKLKY